MSFFGPPVLTLWHFWAAVATLLAIGKLHPLIAHPHLSHHNHHRKSFPSVKKARGMAQHTRPGFPVGRRTPREEFSLDLGKIGRRRLVATMEDAIAVFAPPRMGKTSWLAARIMRWRAGSVIWTSIRDDLHRLTSPFRMTLGEVYLFNPERLGDYPNTLFWSPVDGCADPARAHKRAYYMIQGATRTSEEVQFWTDSKVMVLRILLWAADVRGGTMDDVMSWIANPKSPHPQEALKRPDAPDGWLDDWDQFIKGDPRTTANIISSLSAATAWMRRPGIRDAICPAKNQAQFDFERFVDGTNTLGIIAPDSDYSPLIATMVGEWMEMTRTIAARTKRLRKPLFLALDEAPNICKLPLPEMMSWIGGCGVVVAMVAQAVAQIYDMYGPNRARALLQTANVKMYFPGIDDPETLRNVSSLFGKRFEKSPDGREIEREVMTEKDVREIAEGKVIVTYRNHPPEVVKHDRVWDLPGVGA